MKKENFKLEKMALVGLAIFAIGKEVMNSPQVKQEQLEARYNYEVRTGLYDENPTNNGRYSPETVNLLSGKKENFDSEYNEESIYEMNDSYDGIYHLPVRAMKMTKGNMTYFLLTDGNGSSFVSTEDLIDGQNYIANCYTIKDKEVLTSVTQSSFVFTEVMEKGFENKEFFQQEFEMLLSELVLNKI